MVHRVISLFALLLFAVTVASAQAPVAKSPKGTKPATAAAAQPLAISGLASSGRSCVAGTETNVHVIGWVPNNTRITASFSSDFDPIASVSLVQLGESANDGEHEFGDWVDDDSGGNLEPLIRAVTDFDGMAVLYVSSYSQSNSGCYYFKVEVQTP